jgi:hypothetical protein
MKKVIIGLALVVILGLAIGVYYILTNLDAIVEAAIEKYGSQATQTAVQVDSVRIKLKEGSGAINGLTVANPKGFALSHAFSLGTIKTGIDYNSLKQEPYVINEVTVRAPQVFVEINKDKKTNLNELKKNLSAGKPSDKQEKEADATKGAEPRLIIRKLSFTEGNITAKVTPLNKDYDLKLPNINMANLGGTKGATATELAKEIINRLIDEAKKQIKEKGIDAEVEKLKAKAKAKVEEEKAKAEAKVEEEKAKAKQEADTKVEEEKQKAKQKLQDLLNN